MLDGSEVLATKLNITVREVDGDGVVYNENTGSLHLFNNSSFFIWRCLDGTTSLDEIAKEMANHFSISELQARNDVLEFIEQLKDSELI